MPIEEVESKINLDPRTRLLLGLFCICLLLTSKGAFFPSIILGICLAVIWFGPMPPKRFLHRFLEPLIIVLVLFLIKSLSPKGQVLFELQIPLPLVDAIKITLYEGSLKEGTLLALRVMSCVAVIILLGQYMALHEFIYSLSWLKVPKELVEILLLTNRFISSLLEEAKVVYYSQKNRMGYGSLKNSFRSVGILSGALVIKVLDRTQRASAAMSQRGYEGKIPLPTKAPINKRDLIIGPLIMGGLVILWWV